MTRRTASTCASERASTLIQLPPLWWRPANRTQPMALAIMNGQKTAPSREKSVNRA